ncbi:2',3'-cyclic-nucleotide 2'-phosphodiesterase [Limimaricola hongkongensis DSM 17492]|uniref:2',3'-cyclic-nucleotide 2'-phosphodiesterase n=1 Tax=Limimaricola hongkongensis DSM 17492 TaxID=1122180 RepID=A0A017HE18_9RHOB|nr:2',3'-cyclic-nucleotide 2'-phosphodiesterase [Limimaricola hongkongensis DSM 17492]
MLQDSWAGQSERIALRLLGTTDLHGHVLPWDYLTDRHAPLGLSRLAPLIRDHRRRAANTLLFDNGDFLHGNPMADAESARLAQGTGGGPHAMAAAMNGLGYDAGTLGNHEFNHGLGLLRRVLGQLGHPVTSANLTCPATPLAPEGLLLRRRLRTRDGKMRVLRIGVVGVAPPQTVEWDRMRLAGRIAAGDIVAQARAQAGALRRRGADIVVALAHCGTGPERPLPGAENAGRALAALPGIDALFLGHTHAAHPAPGAPGVLRGTPMVQPGRFGSHLGVIDLELHRSARGRWRVVYGTGRLDTVARTGPPHDPATAAPAQRAHLRTRRLLRRPVGHTTLPITSHFALVAPDASLQLIADAWRAAARRLLVGRPEAALPLLVAVSPFRSGGHAGAEGYLSLPPGPVTERHLRALQPHPDRLCLSVVRRAELLAWLEGGAATFCQVLPQRRDQRLIDPRRPPYGFDVIDGLSWRIDPSRPAGARIGDLRHAGRPVGPEDRFVVATSSHRLTGTGPLPQGLRGGRVAVEAPSLRAALRAHLSAAPVTPRPRRSWRFAALPGTAAWFEAPPEACAAALLIGSRDIAPLGLGDDGLYRYRLRFGPESGPPPIDSAPRLGYGGPARTRTPRCPAAMTP